MEKEKKNNKDLKWKKFLGVFQKNQILIGALALMIAAAGYYAYKKGSGALDAGL